MKYLTALLLLDSASAFTLGRSNQFNTRDITSDGSHFIIHKRGWLIPRNMGTSGLVLRRAAFDDYQSLTRRAGPESSATGRSRRSPPSLASQSSGDSQQHTPRPIISPTRRVTPGSDVAGSSSPLTRAGSSQTLNTFSVEQGAGFRGNQAPAAHDHPSTAQLPRQPSQPPRQPAQRQQASYGSDIMGHAQAVGKWAKAHPATTAAACIGLASCFTAGAGIGTIAATGGYGYGGLAGGLTAGIAGTAAAGSVPMASLAYSHDQANAAPRGNRGQQQGQQQGPTEAPNASLLANAAGLTRSPSMEVMQRHGSDNRVASASNLANMGRAPSS